MAGRSQSLTHKRLKEVLSYNSKTGEFKWLKSGKGRLATGVAGCLNLRGYRVICIDKQHFYAHRLAWFYVTGRWPERGIDHRDTNKANNRLDNLRLATQSQNVANSRLSRGNSSGFKGVYFSKIADKWAVAITVNRVTYYLGFYVKKKAASKAYQEASRKFFGEFARSK